MDKRLEIKKRKFGYPLQTNSTKETSKAKVILKITLKTYEEILKVCRNLNLKV
jgi:hypothetical protein